MPLHCERDNPDDEIEITEEMIAAGECAFYESDPRFETGADRVMAIFEAMIRATPAFLLHKYLARSNTS